MRITTIALFLFLVLTLQSCLIGHYEDVELGTGAFLINEKNGEPISNEIFEGQKVYVPVNQSLIVMNLLPDTIKFRGGDRSKDSVSLQHDCELIFQLQKEKIISLYRRYGADYKDVFIEPESNLIIRELMSKYNSPDKMSNLHELVTVDLRKYFSDHGLILIEVHEFYCRREYTLPSD